MSARAHLGDGGPPLGTAHAVRVAYEEIVDHLLTGGGRRSRTPAVPRPFASRVRSALGVLDDPRAFLSDLSSMVVLAVAFVLCSSAAGWLAGAAVTGDARDRFTIAVEFGTRNLGVAMAVAVTLLV